MRYALAMLMLIASTAFAGGGGLGFVATPIYACPAGGPPALGSGTSSDQNICLNQSVRDKFGDVYTLTPGFAPEPTTSATDQACMLAHPDRVSCWPHWVITPAGKPAYTPYITHVGTAQVQGGIVLFRTIMQPGTTPTSWEYWNRDYKTMWPWNGVYPVYPPANCPGCTY